MVRTDGTGVVAEDGDTDSEFRRGVGGYEGEAETVAGRAGGGSGSDGKGSRCNFGAENLGVRSQA